MNRKDVLLLAIATYTILLAVLWVRFNLHQFRPVLEESLLFFQLALAATIIAVLRNSVGIKTFGVFGPAIISIGLVSVDPLWGLALYIDIFLIVMLTSLAIYPLGMAAPHRVAVVIIVAVMSITIMELIAEIYHMDPLQSTILVPVLITAWLSDRYVSQVKEIDWTGPSKQLGGTLLVIMLAYFPISYQPLLVFTAVNPEVWALLIALNIFLAMKVDFRLSERLRFRDAIGAEGGKEGILSLNRRNLRYVNKHNPPNLYPHIAKDKMKVTMHQLGIPAPQTFAVIEDHKDVAVAEKVMEERDTFVIKPSTGLGGEGILVVDKKKEAGKKGHGKGNLKKGGKGGQIYTARGREYSARELKAHILQILDGQFSLNWEDVAILEEKVINSADLDGYYHGGVPDIRVIVFQGFPVMSMVRLPTKESGGTANLHKGGIGMGLRIADGKGVNPYWPGRGGHIDKHPDTGHTLTDLSLPDWEGILATASRAQAASRLGYAGVDIVLDRKGPMVLEVNKRPGLEIQNTNLAGLLKRLRYVEDRLHDHRFAPVEEKVRLSMKWDREGWR